MKTKLRTLILGLALASHSVDAATSDKITLSKSFTVELPSELHAQMGFMPSLSGFWFEGERQNSKISIWIQRVEAPALANAFSVKRFWHDGIAQASSFGETSQDKGCHALGKFIYECERRAHSQKERYASEMLVWNAQSDLVVVRVMSAKSYEDAEVIAKMISFKPITRLPASLQGRENSEKPRNNGK